MQGNKGETKSSLYRVLIVDDEAPVRELLATLLRSPNRSIEMRDSVRAALEYLEHDPVDVAFVDAKLPGMTGAEFAERIKTRCPHAHVVIHTGRLDATQPLEARPANELRNSRDLSNTGELLELADTYTTE